MPFDPTTGRMFPYPQQGLNVPNSPLGPAAPAAPAAPSPTMGPGGIDRELAETLLGTYGDQLELGAMEKQLAQAEALRDAAAPEGRTAGRVYVAANPLEHLGKGIQQYKGAKRAKALEGDMAGIRTRIGENVKKYGLNQPE